jgi:hypothetical protein
VAKRGFLIKFGARLRTDTGVHRIRNWAEDLFRTVKREQWGAVDDPDECTDTVWVVAASPRVTGDLAKAIRRALKNSNLLDDAVVTKLSKNNDWTEYEAHLSQHSARRLTRR